MAYYNPRLQFLRAIINAFRSFFRTIVSRKLLYIIIITMFILLLHLNTQVKAVTPDHFYDDKYKTFYITEFQYDSDSDSYYADFYTYIGSYLGLSRDSYYINDTIYIPSNLYNLNSWVLHLRPTNTSITAELVQLYDSSTILYVGDRTGYSGWLRVTQPTSYSATGIKRYSSSDFRNWTLTNDYNTPNASWYPPVRDWQPNAILYTKNCTVQFYNNSINPLVLVNSVNMTLRPNIITPTLEVNNNVFTLNMGYFYNFNTTTNSGDSFTKTLNNINTTLTSLSNGNIIYNKDLINITLSYNQDNNFYYISFDLDDINLNINDDDYIFKIYPEVTLTQHLSQFGSNFTEFDYNSIISYPVYYTFNLSDGVISNLILTDSEGNPLQPPQNDDSAADNINGFLQNSDYDPNSIINSMPSSSSYNDVTSSGVDNIFTTLRNTFTSNNYTDFVFTVPFTNGKTITIPSTLTENIIPETIKNIIQMVYWFMISRYIIKDIASYIEKAKSGDIFTKSDTNIKTDML